MGLFQQAVLAYSQFAVGRCHHAEVHGNQLTTISVTQAVCRSQALLVRGLPACLTLTGTSQHTPSQWVGAFPF